jgi:glycosyltransferase involved in cell wall biosynthesis
MPVYNRAHLVPRVVGSICAQTYRNLEIIVVDDASTDAVADALAALNDPRIRLLQHERNQGVAAARNTGVAAARGDWIAFHDSDDLCIHDRIERSARRLAELPRDYVGVYGTRIYHSIVSVSDYGKMRTHVRPFAGEHPLTGDLAARTMENNILNFPTLLVKRSALLAAGPSDPLLRKNVDWDLSLRLTRQGKFDFLPDPLVMTPYPLDADTIAKRVTGSKLHGARSYARITGKLRRQGFGGGPMAAHYATAARYLLLLGRPGFARRFLRASLAQAPLRPKVWALLGLSYFPSSLDRLHRKRQA